MKEKPREVCRFRGTTGKGFPIMNITPHQTSLEFTNKSSMARNVKPRLAETPPAVENSRWVPLTKSLFALIDEDDFDRVDKWYWSSLKREPYSPYAFRKVSNSVVYLHRFIMNAPAGTDVDHRNGNGLDCRKTNLRICSHSQNQCNYRKTRSITSSIFKGVTWDKSRGLWAASIKKDRICSYLGRFTDEEDAARAYDRAAQELFGEFARLNFPMAATGGGGI